MKKNIWKDILFGIIILGLIIAITISSIRSYNKKIIKPIQHEQDVNAQFIKFNNEIIPKDSYKKIKSVKAKTECKGFYSKLNLNDISFFKLKNECLKQVPEANELIDIEIKYTKKTIFGMTKVVAEMSAIAVKSNQDF